MKRIILSFVLAVSMLTAKAEQGYDVVIYGGTSAGVFAAYQVKKLGKSVVIIAPDGHIGGLSSGGLGATDIGNKQAIGGMSREFYKKLGKVYGKPESWEFEPKEAMKIFQDMLVEMNIPVIYRKKIKTVRKNGAAITSITFVNTFGKEDKTTIETINGKVFLDCTYEGDLFAKAKVSYAIGRENNQDYKETLNGYYLAKYRKQSGGHQFPDGVSPYKVPGDPKSGLVYGISKDKIAEQGKGDRKLQAYNFRICLTDSVENQIPITKPDGYQAEHYELLARLFAAQPKTTKINSYFIWSIMPNRKTDVNNRGGFSTDMIGANYNWPEADFDERVKIYNDHLTYTKGLLYFMTTDSRVPDEVKNHVKAWGYPKDEYLSNKHFTPQLYIREGRRMIGEYVMTEHNCTGKEVVPDPIGMAAYTMDSHNIQRIIVDGMVKNEGNVEVGGFKPYPIAYRSIVPQRKQCTNLLVPVSLSSTHIAFGSIRMEPVFMILGQSAAFAAVQAIKENKAVQDIDYQKLKAQLLKHDQVLQ